MRYLTFHDNKENTKLIPYMLLTYCGPARYHFFLLDRVPSKAVPWLERHWLDPQEVRRVQSYFPESK